MLDQTRPGRMPMGGVPDRSNEVKVPPKRQWPDLQNCQLIQGVAIAKSFRLRALGLRDDRYG